LVVFIKLVFKDIAWEDVEKIDLAQGKDRWPDVVVAVLYRRVAQNAGYFFTL
jgi:hypothetical protein